MLDAQSDWYDLANNTWLNKEQREYAKQMQEVERKREQELDSKMNVTIDVARGTTSLKVGEEDKQFTFGNQNAQTNEFLQQTSGKRGGLSFRPFEAMEGDEQSFKIQSQRETERILSSANEFYFKPCVFEDEKSSLLCQEMQPDYMKQMPAASKTQKKAQIEREKQYEEEQKQMEVEARAKKRFLESSLSHRLQSENPFDEFKKAVEQAVTQNSMKQQRKVYEGDKDFYKEIDDTGMCLSMHQPWASLLVMGFKRFEGREWTHKYRGPLWIHATSQKPSQ